MKKYLVIYNCHNCNKCFKKEFSFGVKADAEETCPNCGVWGAKKSTRTTPYIPDLVELSEKRITLHKKQPPV
jgi:anaerobic ribonucleoside-triphosphate reductase